MKSAASKHATLALSKSAFFNKENAMFITNGRNNNGRQWQ